MGFDLKITVGISDFVYRQKPNSGKTYSLLSFSEIAKYAQDKLNKNEFTKGYRDGVVIVKIDDELSKQFICPFVEINDDSLLKAEVARRRPDEEHYIRIKATNGKALETGSVELIIYRNDVLKETNENTTDCDWELISFHALPKGIEEMPMGAVTMMRNQLQLPGGTKGYYESEKWAKSVHFWQKYAIKEIE
ncbi:MAG: hypothetical protein CMF89_00210 [Candidatus Marinimicrobia bacterium]|nr:hypothetical protein [Candidatus Neomarinimicrobiota bacterium]